MVGSPTSDAATWDCPYCGYRADSASSLGGASHRPRDGALSICFRCTMFSVCVVRGSSVSLRYLTDLEALHVPEAAKEQQKKLRRFHATRESRFNDE